MIKKKLVRKALDIIRKLSDAEVDGKEEEAKALAEEEGE